MPRDSAGNYSLVAGNPVQSGEVIASTWANNTLDDVAVALSDSLDRNGRGGMLAPFRFSDGTNLLPGAAWVNETSTGLYRFDGGDLRLAVLTQDVMRWQTTGVEIWNNTDSVWEGVITDGGTAGQVGVTPGTVNGQTLYWDEATDKEWKPTSLLHVDVANSRVGIGVQDPTANLETAGNIKVRQANAGLFLDAAASTFAVGIFSASSSQMEVRNNNVAGTILLSVDEVKNTWVLGNNRILWQAETPDTRLFNTLAAADEGGWSVVYNVTNQISRTIADVGAAGDKYYQVNRTGTQVTLQEWSLLGLSALTLKDSATVDIGEGGAGGTRGKVVINSSAFGGNDAGVSPLEVRKNSAATGNLQFMTSYYSGNTTAQGAILGAGVDAVQFGAQSDISLKENITALPSMWEDFKNLKPVEFDYIDGRGHSMGFIAQDVETVWPEHVGVGGDELKILVGMSRTDAKLVNVIKELITRLEVLENG